MQRPMPTMADKLYGLLLRGPKGTIVKNDFRRWIDDLVSAPKFVLESDVYDFCTGVVVGVIDDGTESDERVLKRLSNIRKMARVPFDTVWIEPASAAGNEGNPMAWLIQRDPVHSNQVILNIIIHERTGFGGEKIPENFGPMGFGAVWSLDDTPVTHPRLETGYSKDVGFFSQPLARKETDTVQPLDDWYKNELSRVTCMVMAFLATIDELPVISRDVRPSKGFFARGKHRNFFRHRVVRLAIPVEKATKKLARYLMAPTRRARHRVRGFWRRLTHDGFACTRLEHDWFVEDNHRLCLECGQEGVFVADHERGDATLGYVLHDYHVTGRKP